MAFSFGNVLLWGAAILALFMLRQLWLSERARRSVERARTAHFTKERQLARARQIECGE